MDPSTPTTQQLTARLSVPLKRCSELSFCQPSVTAIEAFINGLPLANSPERLNRLYRAAAEIAALQGNLPTRLAMLQRIEPVICQHADQLTEHLSLNDKTARQLSLALALQKNLALGYKAVIVDLLSTEHLAHTDQSLLADTLQRAISTLSRMLMTSWQCFVNPPANLWREIHTLFLLSRTLAVDTLAAFSASGNTPLSPHAAYLRIVLIAALDPARFTPRDLKRLWAFLERHAQRATLLYEGEEVLFSIDPSSDKGPLSSSRLGLVKPSFIGLDSTALATYVAATCHDNELALSAPDSALPHHLATQAQRYWQRDIRRRDDHCEDRHEVSAVFGLSRFHRLLTQSANIDDFVSHSRDTKTASSGSFDIAIAGDPAPGWPDERDRQAGHHLWLQPASCDLDKPILFAPQHTQRASAETHTQTATQINHSERGACIELSSAPQNLAPGELVAIRADGNEPWRVGLVRWSRTTNTFSRLVGIEFIDKNFTPCAAAINNKSQRRSAYFPALIAADRSGEEQLLVPALPFSQGNHVTLIGPQVDSDSVLRESLEVTHQLALYRLAKRR